MSYKTTLEAAIEYSKHGLSVIPVGRDKKPFFTWKRWQIERADEAQIRSWWTQYPSANVAIVTGEISGLVVLDCDSQEGVENIEKLGGVPNTPCVKTGKGKHFYFQRPDVEALKNFARKVAGLDFRGDGGYVLAPPSIHPTGAMYEWEEENQGASCSK